MSILNVKNVSYSYEKSTNKVLKDVNIDFDCGNIYSIVGKSGSGKTTLLSLISGLDICSSGEILYNDRNLAKIDRDKYRSQDIGVIFQGYNLLTNCSAIENIILAMEISKSKVKNKRDYAYHLLECVGIDKDKASRKILKLSGGEQQRVAIARALSNNPKIIIADEPTGNLDSDTERDILNILEKLAHQENKCVVIVTHSKEVSAFADYVYGLANGELLCIK